MNLLYSSFIQDSFLAIAYLFIKIAIYFLTLSCIFLLQRLEFSHHIVLMEVMLLKSCEKFVSPSSDYYNYTPSIDAKRAFFYPICTGHFIYEAGYEQHRTSFDSFLLMYIQSGALNVSFGEQTQTVSENHFVLIDCYQPHGYTTSTGWECMWVHFDGPVARLYYDMIVNHLGNIFSLNDPLPILNKIAMIYRTFSTSETIREALLCKQLADILTSFLLYTPEQPAANNNTISMEEIVSYINEHFSEDLSIETMAEKAMLSPYHFIRIFKKETGFTPHEYLINTRISNAKYMLKNTKMSIKDICFHTGFSCESVFCTSFKRNVGMPPAAYRNESVLPH